MSALAMALDQWRKNFGAIDYALQIDVYDPVPVTLTHCSGRAADGYTGIVADDVDLAERSHGVERRASHARAVGDVDKYRRRLDLLGGEFVRRELRCALIDVGKHDVHARTAECARHA